MKVIVESPVAKEGVELLKDEGYEVVEIYEDDPEVLLEEIGSVDAILARPTGARVTAEVLREGDRLQVVSIHGVGCENVDIDMATEEGIYVLNTPNANTEAVVEHTFGLMSNLSKRILEADRATRNGDYETRDQYIGVEMKGKTLGVIGLGRIGLEVGRRLGRACGMEVVGCDPYLGASEFPDEIEYAEDLEKIFEVSDFITVHCPLTEGTEGLIGQEELHKMKESAFLINVARGGIVDEDALVDALKEGEIRGAAIDVFKEEPPADDHPLFDLNNVIVTPHTAWLTEEARRRMSTGAAEGIITVLRGDIPEHTVNQAVCEE